jgi:hypothetical protein
MATTLSYGYVQPQNGDQGSVWFPALNTNISLLNGHVHDGITSALLSAGSVVGGTVSIPAASWVADVTGRYKQNVTAPAGYNMTGYAITFYLSTGEIVHPSITQLTSTTFTVYGPDNTLTYTAVFR